MVISFTHARRKARGYSMQAPRTRGRYAEADGDHDLDAGVRRRAAGDAGDAFAVVRVRRNGAGGVRAVRVYVRTAEEVQAGAVGVVVPVAVVYVAVVVVVDAVAANLAGVAPDVELEVLVAHVEARVEDLWGQGSRDKVFVTRSL
jgi:hypothetical protein